MQKKLNEDFIDAYCEKFARQVTSNFFIEGKESITGKEIIKVTPSKQVNYFVIKLIFRYWQEETKKLESPFFNYNHPDVKQALIEFMNVLSQHIEVDREKFQLLLNHAAKDALYLAAMPEAYIEIDLESRGVDKISEKVIAGTLKYLRLYKKEVHNFLSDMRGLTIDDVIDEVGPEFEEFDSSEGLAEEIGFLNQVLPITADQVLVDFDTQDDFDDFDDDDLFERGEEDLIERSAPKPKAEKASVQAPPSTSEPEPAAEVATTEAPEESAKVEEVPKVEEPKTEAPKVDSSADESAQETAAPTINDQFSAPKETVADHHEKTQESTLMKAISVNHQYMFQKELFSDDPVSFQSAIYELEDFKSFDESVEFLVQGYAKEYKWDMQSMEVKELLKYLFRKFRD